MYLRSGGLYVHHLHRLGIYGSYNIYNTIFMEKTRADFVVNPAFARYSCSSVDLVYIYTFYQKIVAHITGLHRDL